LIKKLDGIHVSLKREFDPDFIRIPEVYQELGQGMKVKPTELDTLFYGKI